MKIFIWISLVCIFFAFGIAGYLSKRVIYKPDYLLIERFKTIEIREYKKIIIATTVGGSSYKNATYSGFRTLANYIFGGNEKNIKIPMTAPVITSMPNNDNTHISFVMSQNYTLETLPIPQSNQITFKEVSLGKVAVIKFGMWANPKRIIKMKKKLETFLFENKIKTSSEYLVAQYNSPWVMPPFRKNEIIVSIN